MAYFFNLSNLALFILLSFFFISFSILAICLVRRFIPLSIRYKDNPVIGNISALISIISGVLVGLMALYLINNVSATADAVQREANALADIYRDSKWLSDPAKTKIRDNIKKYANYVIHTEWPLMKSGETIDNHGNYFVLGVTENLINYPQKNNAESLLVHDMLDLVKTFYDARQERILFSYSNLSGEIWIVILIGTLLTLMINYIYGMNFFFHLITVSAVALMAASMIFLLLTLDRPFQGEFIIEPQALQDLIEFIDKPPPTVI